MNLLTKTLFVFSFLVSLNDLPPVLGIINGRNASDLEAPYQVALFFNGTWSSCGGSLIGERTVLTAAHCTQSEIHKRNPEKFSIRYGTNDISQGTDAKVVKVISHPLFNETTVDYDICVLHLEGPFKHSSKAAIIPLASKDPADGSHASVTGWGMRNISKSEETRILQKANTLVTVNRGKCNSTWHSLIPITENMICAGSKTQAFCHGDSGGPLVSLINSKPELVGVVSFSLPECNITLTQPSVFADVAHLRGWIEENSAK